MTSADQERFFDAPALELAPRVLGGVVHVRDLATGEVTAVRLTEVEAYEGEHDPGSHGFRGPTPRTAPMFEAGGRLYVYFSYGMHWCANLVCGAAGTSSALLLRGGEVMAGIDAARERRAAGRAATARALRDAELARGPANLARALGLTGEDTGAVLDTAGRAWFTPPAAPVAADRVRTGPRVGVSGEGGSASCYPWRFRIAGEPSVSAFRAGARTARRTS